MSLLSGGVLLSQRAASNGAATPWVRQADWLPLPFVGPTDEKFVGLFAVANNSANFLALNAGGNYTVDWGDGTVENKAGNALATHQYDYASIPTTTLSSRGYKQVVVTVTPQAGSQITYFDLSNPHPTMGYSNYAVPWLDVSLSLPNVTALWVGGNYVSNQYIERVNLVRTGVLSTCESMLNSLTLLQSLIWGDVNTSQVQDFSRMLRSCDNLPAAPMFDTSSGRNFSWMLSNCDAIQTIPQYSTPLGTDFSHMFDGSRSLLTIPLIDTHSATTLAGMFRSCTGLQAVPAISTGACLDFSGMFSGCVSMRSAPALNTAAGQNFNGMFSDCHNLQILPLLDTSQGTNFSEMFQTCYSLWWLPAMNMVSGQDFTNMFSFGTTTLSRAPLSGVSKSIDFSNCRLGRAELVEIFNGLAAGVTGQTINVSGNWGAADLSGLDRGIATAKGWTVVG